MDIRVPEASLVVLCGVAGSGKSTFAANNFKATEVVSSDRCRAIITDDEGNLEASKDAFELFHFIIAKRMKSGKLVIADSTALSYDARKKLLHIAHDYNYNVILLIFDVPLEKAIERNKSRDRQVPEQIIENQYLALKKTLRNIDKEGFDEVIKIEEDDIGSINCTITPSNEIDSNNNQSKNISKVFGHSQPPRYERIKLDEFIKPLYFKSRHGYEIRVSKEEVEESIRLLSLYPEILPWIVYMPAFAPALSSGSLTAQIQYALNYYADQGINKCVVERRKHSETKIIVLSKDKHCSSKYFSGDSPGQIYPLNLKPQIDEQDKDRILKTLSANLKNSGYFEHHDTDYIIFEALLCHNGTKDSIEPLRIIANSRKNLLDRDNLWQVENTKKFSSLSEIMCKSEVLVIDNKNYKTTEIDSFIDGGECESIVVKPVKVYARHSDRFLQPEILCSVDSCFYGNEYIKLSMAAFELGYLSVEMFVENKMSKKYFEFLLGCVTINSRMSRMRK